MLSKLIGAEQVKEINGITVKAVPLPYAEFIGFFIDDKDNVFKLGAALMHKCVTDIEGLEDEPEYAFKEVLGVKRRFVASSTLASLPEPVTVELLPWIAEIHLLSEEEQGN